MLGIGAAAPRQSGSGLPSLAPHAAEDRHDAAPHAGGQSPTSGKLAKDAMRPESPTLTLEARLAKRLAQGTPPAQAAAGGSGATTASPKPPRSPKIASTGKLQGQMVRHGEADSRRRPCRPILLTLVRPVQARLQSWMPWCRQSGRLRATRLSPSWSAVDRLAKQVTGSPWHLRPNATG